MDFWGLSLYDHPNFKKLEEIFKEKPFIQCKGQLDLWELHGAFPLRKLIEEGKISINPYLPIVDTFDINNHCEYHGQEDKTGQYSVIGRKVFK